VVAVIAVPYVLDVMSSKQKAALGPLPGVTPAPAPTPTPAPTAPATPPAPPPAMTEPAKPEEPTAKAPEPERPTAVPSLKADAPVKAAPSKPAGKPAVARAKAASAAGPYWVQVGAFREAAAAKQVAERLRAANYSVEESMKPGGAPAPTTVPAPSTAADRYNVFVSGATPAEVNAKVAAKGFSADAVAGGVAVKPSLSLKEAVDLSRELAGEGMKVQVRRAAGGASPATPAPAPASGGETWHRVRVGAFPDRAAAVVVLKELEAKGYKPFLARGPQ